MRGPAAKGVAGTFRVPSVLWIGAALLAAGCGAHHNNQLLESELHAREVETAEMRDQLACCRAQNQALDLELRTLRGEVHPPLPGAGPGPVLSDKPPLPVYPLSCVTLGRQTGGHPCDHGGDDALVVLIEPRDPQGHAVKVPGAAVLVQALEVTPEGLKRPLSTWEVTPEQMSSAWNTGLLSCGYRLTLLWKMWPSTDKLRVVAQLRLPDGRVFEADKDVAIRVAVGAQRLQPPPGAPAIAAPPPVPSPPSRPAGPVLPPPTPVETLPSSLWHAPVEDPPVEMLPPLPERP
jgi:hypothetical protein